MPRGVYTRTKERCWMMNQHGENNSQWKGDTAPYRTMHHWVSNNLGKPRICVECGITTAKVYDWANISGEYRRDLSDYKRLCRSCHKKFDDHSLTKGSRNGMAKLTEGYVRSIRSLYATGEYTYKDLAMQFNVCMDSIRWIIKRKTWKHVK